MRCTMETMPLYPLCVSEPHETSTSLSESDTEIRAYLVHYRKTYSPGVPTLGAIMS